MKVENAVIKALETPVPRELADNIRAAARRETVARAWRRRAAWLFAPLATGIAAAVVISLFSRAPQTPSAPGFQLAQPIRQAQTLVSLAAGGNEFYEEVDVNTLARDLLSLQGF